jgi:hypothetical protein
VATSEVGIKITAVDDTKSAFGSINSGLAGLGNAAAGVSSSLAALGIGLSAGAFVAFAKNVINGIDALNDLKDATGSSIENISALEDVARRTGTTLDTVGTSLVKLNQALGNAKPGSDTEKAITAIGLSVKDLKALDPAEAFRQIAVGLSGFADDSNKARLTQELFGKSLKEVAPLLKDLAEQGALVGTVTTEQADATEKINKQLFNLQANVGDASRAMVSQLVPTLNILAEEFTKSLTAADGLGKFFADVFKATLEVIGVIVANVSYILQNLGRNIGGVAASLVALGTLDIKGFVAISQAMAEDGERGLKELEKLEQRILGFGTTVGKTVSRAARDAASAIASGAYKPPSVGEIGGGPDKAAIAAANAELKKQADLLAKLAGNNADYMEQLTRLQAIRKSGNLTEQEYIDNVTALINLQPGVKAATDAQTAADKAAEKALLDVAAARLKYNTTLGNELEKLQKETAAQQEYNARLGLSKDAIAALDAAKLEEQATTLDGMAIKVLDKNLDTERYELYKAQAAELRKLAQLRKDGASKETALDGLKKTQDEAKRLGEQLENIISDGLMRGFENGKTFAENFRSTLENVFKTMILKPVIQATVQGALGLDGGNGGGAGGIGSFVSSLQAAGKAFENASFALTDFKEFATLGAQDFGSVLTKAGFKDAGGYLSSASGSTTVGNAINSTAVALSYLEAVSNFKDGTYGQSIGQAIGTAWAGPIGGQIGKALGGIADRIFGGDQGPTAAGVNSSFDAQGNLTGRVKSGATSNAEVDQFTSLLGASYQQILTKFGATGKASTFGFQKTSDGFFDVSANVGGAGVFQQGRTAYSEASLQLASSRAIFAALQASDLPQYLSKAFDGIVANTASADQINGALAFADSLKSIRFGLLSATEQQAEYQKIIDASTASLGTSAATFRTDFIAAIDEGLTPETLAQWNALGGTLQALEQITGKAASGVTEVVRSLADIANEGKRLQDQLDSLTLSSAQLLDKQRNALDESNRALFDQVQTATQAKDAADALAEAQADQAQAAKDAADQAITNAKGLQQSIGQRYASPLTAESAAAMLPPDIAAQIGTVSGKVIRDTVFDYVNALDPLSASGQAALTALEKMTPALDFFANAADQAAEKAKQLADAVDAETKSLADRLAVATGSKTSQEVQRANELASALTDQSRATLRAIFAAEDLAASQTANAAAFEAAKRSAQSATDQAFAAVQRAVAAQRSALQAQVQVAQESVRNLDSIFNTLQGGVDRLRGTVGGFTAQSASAFLAQSLSAAQTTGYLPDAQQLGSAVNAAIAGVQETIFASDAEAKFEQLKLAGQLDALKDITGTQRTAAERVAELAQLQLNTLDAQLAAAQDQIDALRGVDKSVGTVEEAVRALNTALNKEAAVNAGGGGSIALPEGSQAVDKAAEKYGASLAGYTQAALKSIDIYLAALPINADKKAVQEQIKFFGQVYANVPSFDIGTNYVPRDMLAMVHEGEAIVPKAYNPAANPSGNLEKLVEGLTAEVQRLQAVVAIGNANTRRTAEAVNGNPEQPMLVATV